MPLSYDTNEAIISASGKTLGTIGSLLSLLIPGIGEMISPLVGTGINKLTNILGHKIIGDRPLFNPKIASNQIMGKLPKDFLVNRRIDIKAPQNFITGGSPDILQYGVRQPLIQTSLPTQVPPLPSKPIINIARYKNPTEITYQQNTQPNIANSTSNFNYRKDKKKIPTKYKNVV